MTNYKYIIKQFNPEILAELIVSSERLSKDNCPDNCFAKADCDFWRDNVSSNVNCETELVKWFRKTRE